MKTDKQILKETIEELKDKIKDNKDYLIKLQIQLDGLMFLWNRNYKKWKH